MEQRRDFLLEEQRSGCYFRSKGEVILEQRSGSYYLEQRSNFLFLESRSACLLQEHSGFLFLVGNLYWDGEYRLPTPVTEEWK